MFNLAKATGADARENFTTEALAAAIRLDPRPMIDALVTHGFKRFDTFEMVSTQVDLGCGVLDIVLTSPVGHPVIWVEVKVHAGEHDGQLARYLDVIAKIKAAPKPRLVLLAPSQLSQDKRVVWLRWQALYDAIPDGAGPWSDFKLYLKEIGMADDSKTPVTATEAASIGPAHGFLGKVVQILIPAAKHANTLWQRSSWPEDPKDVRRMITSRFTRWPSFTVQHQTSYRCGATMGVYHEAETNDAWLGIWVWANPRYAVERDRILAVADKGLSKPWCRDPAQWELLGAYERLTRFDSQDPASRWLIERLDELKAVGMFDAIENLGAGGGSEDGAERE